MTLPFSRAFAIGTSIISVTLLVLVFAFALPKFGWDIDDVLRLTTAEHCVEGICERSTLPGVGARNFSDSIIAETYRFEIPDVSGEVTGVLLPRLSDLAQVRVAGIAISPVPTPDARRWNAPFFLTFPNVLLDGPRRDLEITLMAGRGSRISLSPILVGSVASLEFHYQAVAIYRVGLARIAFGLTVIAIFVFAVMALLQRRERFYRWLLVANLAQLVFLWHIMMRFDPIDTQSWLLIWVSALHIHVFAMYRFVSGYLNLKTRKLGYLVLSVQALCIFLIWCHNPNWEPWLIGIMAVCSLILYIHTLSFWLLPSRRLVHLRIALFGLMSISAAGVIAEALRQIGWLVPYDREVYHLATAPIFLLYLVMMIHHLLSAQAANRRLIRDLRGRIKARMRELKETHEKLSLVVEQEAVSHERQRIMMDLHDGVGGQLVNTLAYVNGHPQQDPVLQDALAGALRDLGLMVDSLQMTGSVVQLLGALRRRIEPMLETAGMKFDWEIGEEPQLPTPGMMKNLTLLRLVQEAITNAVRHANATTVKVTTTQDKVIISDDGTGFDVALTAGRSGIGILSMRKRADELGAELYITSGPKGTSVTLNWG
ncbi:sensor histidine kinase [Neptunicoccus cionae]|uniref:sensor histidine kinase n=1 Tax=Neptunicoccus cionae TaxID=2035344 RepID=UPI000C77DE24|nr:ATP-binding protein [Amylibacter cionae]PLS20976.1 hypothetical protein C0U40_12485 [Amylibacter cionae]